MTALKDLTLEDEVQETMTLASYIDQKVIQIGKESAIEKITKGLNISKVKSEIEKQEVKERITYYLDNLQNLHLFNGFRYGNDVARALALKLGVLKKVKVNKHNILSYHASSRQYDPQKNGLNILKHGLGFDEVLSTTNGTFAELSVGVFEEGDQRHIAFTRALDRGKYIVSVIKFHSAEEGNSEIEQELIKITEDVIGKATSTEGKTVEEELSREDLYEIMNRSKHLRNKIHNTEPMTFISSWYFDVNNFDKTVTERIRFTGDHDVRDPKAAAKEMKGRALIILKEAWGIEIK